MLNMIKSSMLPIILSASLFAGCAPGGGASSDEQRSPASEGFTGDAPAPTGSDPASVATGTVPSTSTLPVSPEPVAAGKSRGIRVDPGYFYSSHPGQSVDDVARDVVNTVKNARGNTLYLYAYNTVHGALYPTNYSQTTVEPGYGTQNVFGAVTAEAKRQGLKVVAVVPLNNFKTIWENNSAWRSKQAGGADYVPQDGTYLLSASHPDYRAWYQGFLNDLIARNPQIDQVEAVEPTMDYSWNGVPDQNPAALAKFAAAYPSAAVGSQEWLNFRTNEFLSLIMLFNQTVHARGKQTALVHTWTVTGDGHLSDATAIKNSTGFDWIAVSKLTGASKTDYLITEFIWQQWYSTFGTAVFNPDWITSIAAEYNNTLKNAGATSTLIIHVEISNFAGAYNSTRPTNDQFGQTMANTAKLSNSVSVYDFNQIKNLGAFGELSKW
ncbi:MAG: hypothetical protein K0R29_1616 [Pseudobdellovibrio sp.]|jgi:hypothetical protein|nr:hypothetical protein [Pseudobdellovibrio sp.]